MQKKSILNSICSVAEKWEQSSFQMYSSEQCTPESKQLLIYLCFSIIKWTWLSCEHLQHKAILQLLDLVILLLLFYFPSLHDLFIYLFGFKTWMGNRSITSTHVSGTEEWIKSSLSGKIKESPDAACGDNQLIQWTPAGSLQPATLCVGSRPLHQSHCCAAPPVYAASAPFTGGDRGRDNHAIVLGAGSRSDDGRNVSCCSEFLLFQAIQTGKASEDAGGRKSLFWLLWRSKVPMGASGIDP